MSTVKKEVAINVKIIKINKGHVYIISFLWRKKGFDLNFFGDEKLEATAGLNVVKTNTKIDTS